MLEHVGEGVLSLPDQLVELGRADEGCLIDLGAVSCSAGDLGRLLKFLQPFGEACKSSIKVSESETSRGWRDLPVRLSTRYDLSMPSER